MAGNFNCPRQRLTLARVPPPSPAKTLMVTAAFWLASPAMAKLFVTMAPGVDSVQFAGALHFGWPSELPAAAMPVPAPMPAMPACGSAAGGTAFPSPKWIDFKNSRKAGFAPATTSESPRILKNQEAPSRGIIATTVRSVAPANS